MKTSVLFFIESLGGGGAEKVLETIIQYINKDKFDITVCTICGNGIYQNTIAQKVKYKALLYPPHNNIISKFLYSIKYHIIYNWLPLWMVYLLFLPHNNKIEIAFTEGFATKLLAHSTNRKSKKMAWVHIDLKQKPWPLELAIYDSHEEEITHYKKYDQVICVSKSVELIMKNYYSLTNTKTIYNPLDIEKIRYLSNQPCPIVTDQQKINIVSVGRMTHQKGYDLLLPIFKDILQKHQNVHLWLIGSGEQSRNLNEQAKILNIEKHVTFTGFLENPYSLIKSMDVFVCSSRAEGFSLVIAESMILGLPIISTNCSGPNELLHNNQFGYLCNSMDELKKHLLLYIEKKLPHKKGLPSFLDLNKTIETIEKVILT